MGPAVRDCASGGIVRNRSNGARNRELPIQTRPVLPATEAAGVLAAGRSLLRLRGRQWQCRSLPVLLPVRFCFQRRRSRLSHTASRRVGQGSRAVASVLTDSLHPSRRRGIPTTALVCRPCKGRGVFFKPPLARLGQWWNICGAALSADHC